MTARTLYDKPWDEHGGHTEDDGHGHEEAPTDGVADPFAPADPDQPAAPVTDTPWLP